MGIDLIPSLKERLNLDDLKDVEVASPSDGEAPIYDAASALWKGGDPFFKPSPRALGDPFDSVLPAMKDGIIGNGVISGCGVTAIGFGLWVYVAAGNAIVNGVEVAVSGQMITDISSDPTNPKKVIISLDSSATASSTSGTPAAAIPSGYTGPDTEQPTPPSIPSNEDILAEIWVGAGATEIVAGDITDRRLFVKPKHKWKDASENALTLLNQTSFIDWTALDLTAYTSAAAKWVYLRLRLHIDSILESAEVGLYVRKKDTSTAATPAIYGTYANGLRDGGEIWGVVFCGMDAGQEIEYYLAIIGAAVQLDVYIDVLGYIES